MTTLGRELTNHDAFEENSVMTDEKEKRGWDGISRRRVPRFSMRAPLDVTVLRSGIPDTVPGRSTDVGERGIAAMIAGELIPGETVGVEIVLSASIDPLRTRAIVRHQDKLRCGLEFVAMSAEQRAVIRDWAREPKTNKQTSPAAVSVFEKIEKSESSKKSVSPGAFQPSNPNQGRKRYLRPSLIVLLVMMVGAAVFAWRWNRGWQELESGLRASETAAADKPSVQVPTEVMERLLVHRVEPAYPPEARKQNLQGIIALDIIVGRDGSVVSVRPLNGPDVLARAAIDALRWWTFEPYRVNGEPAVVETTLALEFKK